jgi:hypothetical protein
MSDEVIPASLNEDAEWAELKKAKASTKTKKRLNSHLKMSNGRIKNKLNKKQQKLRVRKRRLQKINEDNAEEKKQLIQEILEISDNKVNLIADEAVKTEIEQFYPEVLEEKKIGWTPFPGPQTHFLEADEFEALFSGGRAPGKALCLYEQVLTPSGFKPIEDINIGDSVICPDNTVSKVIDIPFVGEDVCYRIEFVDGRVIDCSQNHLWSYEVSNRTLKPGSQRRRVATTKELLDKFTRYKETTTKYKILIPLTSAVTINSKAELPIAPYTLGALLGDGSFRGRATQITCYDNEIIDRIKSEGYSVTAYANMQYGVHELGPAKRELGLYGKLSHEKFIPKQYLTAPIEDRYALLQGLMDTDGYSGGSKGTEYCSVSYQLAEDVRTLVWSLGGKASIRTKQGSYKDKEGVKILCKAVYRVLITLPDNSRVFYLPRKIATANTKFNGGVTVPKLAIKNITPIGTQPCKCISIEHPDKLFITSNYVVTHNSDALLMDPMRYCGSKSFRGLIIRTNMKDLRDLINRAKEIYPQCYPGTKWKEQEKLFTFPSGAIMEFGYCEHENDVAQYQGQEYTWLGIDELTQLPTEEMYEKLISSVRKTGDGLKNYVRSCMDEGDVLTGRGWIPIQDVVVGDTVYSCLADGTLVPAQVYNTESFDVDEELVRIKKKNLYVSMTQDHRVLHRVRATDRHELCRWNELKNKTVSLVRHGKEYTNIGYTGETLGMQTEDFLAFLGLYLAEGSITQKVHNGNYTICITQLKQKNFLPIKNLLQTTGLKFWYCANGDFKAHNKKFYTYLSQFGKAKDKHIPQDILATATKEQLEIIFNWLMLGDGHWQTDTSATYVTTSKRLADNVAEIGVKLDYKVMITELPSNNPNHNTRYNIYLTRAKSNTTLIEPEHAQDVYYEHYKGKVYCISVKDTENFVVRQRGTVHVTGNTTNPNGPGKAWVKRRFIDKAPANKTITIVTNIPGIGEIKRTRKWIHGTVFDNPKYTKDRPEYIADLYNINNEVLRKQWLDGDWDTADGLAFDEFSRKDHVIEPFDIPNNWYRFRACDWGYKTKAVCHWFAVDYDGRIYVYRELVTSKVLAKDFGKMIRDIEAEAGEVVRYGILDASAWSQRGEDSPSPAEDMAGLIWRPSDRTKHSRVTGKQQVHRYLQKDESGIPGVQIFNNCTDLIACLSSIPLDKNNPEDVDTKAEDHSYDSFRYGLMSRPKIYNSYDFEMSQPQQPQVIDEYFGY